MSEVRPERGRERATAPRSGGALRLADGRTLGYAEFGDPDGAPIVFCHGHPGSRLEAALLHEPAVGAGARLIGVDRPGMGLSDFQPGRRILDWPTDIERLADVLRLARFTIAGASGGGPYALACAHSIPERLAGCGLISSVGPPGLVSARGELWANRAQRRLTRIAPPALDLVYSALGLWLRSRGQDRGPAALGEASLRSLPGVDRRALGDPPGPERLGADLLEAFARGGRGGAREARLLYRPWGFDLGEIRTPHVRIWHGDLDRNVPLAAGRALAGAIPGSRLTVFPGEGHFSVALGHADEILADLLTDAGSGAS